jgi:hypothetical protein
MATSKLLNVAKAESQVKQKPKETGSSAPIRVKQRTKAKLEQLLKQTNKDRIGRRIKADDLIWCGLALINDVHIAEIRDNSLSNKDRMELLFQQFLQSRRGATREDFLGELLKGRLNQ